MSQPGDPPQDSAHVAAIHGVSSSAAAGLASMAGNLLLLPLIIATVGPGQYGLWLVLVVVATYLHYSDFGVGAAIVHFGSRRRGGGETRTLSQFVSAGLVWSSGVALVVVPAYLAIAYTYVDNSRDHTGISAAESHQLVLLGLVATASFVIKPFSAALQAAGLMPLERRNFVVGVVVRVLGTVVACVAFDSITAIATAETLALVAPHVASWITVSRRGLAPIKFDRGTLSTLRLMLSFSIRSFGVAAAGALLLQGGTLLAGFTVSPAYATYFNAAFRVYGSIRQLLQWLIDPFRSVLSRGFAQDPDGAQEIVFRLAFLTLTAAIFGCVPIMLASPDLIEIWLGADVPVGRIAVTTSVLMAGLLLNAAHFPLAPAGDASGRPGVFLPPQLFWLITFTGAGLVIGPEFGIVGIATALSLPLILVEPWYFYIAHQKLGIEYNQWVSRALKPSLLAISGGVPVAALSEVIFHSTTHLAGLISAAAFSLGAVASSWLFRRTLPWSHAAELFRVSL